MNIFNIYGELDFGEKWNDMKYLKKLLGRINCNMDSLKCVHETYKRLHYEYDKTWGTIYVKRNDSYSSHYPKINDKN